jgi:hypothetical protein
LENEKVNLPTFQSSIEVMKTIRASEIGAYLYCKRAWWYQRQGFETANLAELEGGVQIHQRHEQAVAASGCIRILAYLLLLLALILLTIYIVELVI